MKHLAIVVLAVLSVMLCASAIQAQTTPVYLESTQTLLNKSLTFTGGETLVADDGTNVVLTLNNRAGGTVQVILGGTTNVDADTFTIDVIGNDANTTNITYLSSVLTIDDVSSGTEDSSFAMSVMVAGTSTERIDITATGGTLTGAWIMTTNSQCNGSFDIDTDLNVDGAAVIDGATTIAGGLVSSGATTISNATIKLGGLQSGTSGLAVGELYYDSVNGTNFIAWFGP